MACSLAPSLFRPRGGNGIEEVHRVNARLKVFGIAPVKLSSEQTKSLGKARVTYCTYMFFKALSSSQDTASRDLAWHATYTYLCEAGLCTLAEINERLRKKVALVVTNS